MTSPLDSRAYRRDIGRYDDLADKYEDMKVQSIRDKIHTGFLDWLAKSGITEPKRILDVGCGTGALLRAFAQRFPDAELTGVDISPKMLQEAEARQTDGRAKFLQAPAEELPLEDGQFDLVVSTICFHHWQSRVRGIAEVRRVLAPGGRFGLVDHFAIGWLRPTFAVLRMRDRVHTPAELKSIMAKAGLTVHDWELLYSLGRLPYIHGVLAERPAN
jgi:ubiquinone/menaquinone biosynthesis C-methylase UbiE